VSSTTNSILLILISGLFQGSFGLGMKKYAPLAWEAFWLLFALSGMLIIPCIWTMAVVPDVPGVIGKMPLSDLWKAIGYGAGWGIGAIMFGLAIVYLGVSLGNAIPMGLASAVGSIVPLLQIPDSVSKPSFPYILTGIFIMLIGLTVLALAGILRDRQMAGTISTSGIKQGKQFFLGLLFAVLSGLLSACANIGYIKAGTAAKIAIAQGAEPRNASMMAWIIVFSGNFLVSLIYSVIMLYRNKSLTTFRLPKAYTSILWSIAAAFMWFAALAFYGQGATAMGQMGTVVGWTMFMALALVISNIWGIIFKEWKGVKKPFFLMIIGNLILIFSFAILGYSNSI
jgi:L-rhamnose-H+ transport protein